MSPNDREKSPALPLPGSVRPDHQDTHADTCRGGGRQGAWSYRHGRGWSCTGIPRLGGPVLFSVELRALAPVMETMLQKDPLDIAKLQQAYAKKCDLIAARRSKA